MRSSGSPVECSSAGNDVLSSCGGRSAQAYSQNSPVAASTIRSRVFAMGPTSIRRRPPPWRLRATEYRTYGLLPPRQRASMATPVRPDRSPCSFDPCPGKSCGGDSVSPSEQGRAQQPGPGAEGEAPGGRQRAFWLGWLQVMLVMLMAYGLLMVVAGSVAESLFSALGFGPPESIRSSDVSVYLRLPFAVLGAVLAGWATLMLFVVRGPLAAGAAWALRAMALSLGLWFVLDTGMSLVLGYPTHALFNLLFAAALGLPLWQLRRSRDSNE